MIDKLPTGVPGLDFMTGGGLPKGRATLITGKSGTCKTIMAMQIAGTLARVNGPVLVISAEEEPEDLVQSANDLGFDFATSLTDKCLVLNSLMPTGEGPIVVAGEFDMMGLVHMIESYVQRMGVKTVVVDSTTALLSGRTEPDRLRAHFFQLIYALRRMGMTTIVTSEAPDDYGPLTTLGVEEFVCDAVVVLRNVVDGDRRRRSIEVHKYRRSGHYKGQFPCTMTNRGLTVFPLDAQARERPFEAGGRYSSGLEGLDKMNHGGWLRDSIVLVRGPSGGGKTTLSGMYARAGAMRGERVVYYGFEETKPMLMRNFRALGLGMEEFEAAGNLKIVCRYPEATSPEDLLVDIRNGLDEFRPSLVVFDSVSSIEHSTSKLAFRQFLVGVAALLREHGRSALLTQTITNLALSEEEVPYLSTIPDVILLLDYRTFPDSMERTIRVLKMRGSSHETGEHVFRIDPGGLAVEPLARKR